MKANLYSKKAGSTRLYEFPKGEETAQKFNLVNIQEDLLNGQETRPLSRSAADSDINKAENEDQILINDQNPAPPIKLVVQLIAKEPSKTADALDVGTSELQAWIDLQATPPFTRSWHYCA